MKRTESSMFYEAKPTIFKKAFELRNAMTKSELKLWEMLSKNQLLDLRFKAQHPIDKFIADFYCHSLKLIIEIDGEVHNLPENKEYDMGRTFELEKFGIKIIRFTNEQIMNDIDNVKKEISKVCNDRKNELTKLPQTLKGFSSEH